MTTNICSVALTGVIAKRTVRFWTNVLWMRKAARLLRAVGSTLVFLAALAVPALSQVTVSLPDATLNKAYGPIQLTAQGTAGTVTWSAQPSATPLPPGVLSPLPPGITVDTTNGTISGTPSTLGEYAFVLLITSTANPADKGQQKFRIKINDALSIALAAPAAPAAPAAVPDQRSRKNQTPLEQAGSNSDELTISVAKSLAAPQLAHIDQSKLKINNDQEYDVIDALLTDQKLEDGDYCIVQIVKWSPSDGKEGAPKYEAQDRWWLYQRGRDPKDDTKVKWTLQKKYDGGRLFGSKRVAALFLHLNALATWDIRYTATVTKRIPANIQNALDLAGVILGGGGKGISEAKGPTTVNLWGGQLLTNIKEVPSDLAFSGKIQFVQNEGASNQQAKEYTKSYLNEGRYHWDVSAGLQLKSFSEVQYDASNGTVTPKKVERQNAYGFLNLFLNPKGVDLNDDAPLKTLHLVVGVPISGKPLDRPMVGLGLGIYKTPVKFNIFAGPVFNRIREPQTLQAGQAATQGGLESDMRTRRVTKFIFGVNLPIKQFVKALGQK